MLSNFKTIPIYDEAKKKKKNGADDRSGDVDRNRGATVRQSAAAESLPDECRPSVRSCDDEIPAHITRPVHEWSKVLLPHYT